MRRSLSFLASSVLLAALSAAAQPPVEPGGADMALVGRAVDLLAAGDAAGAVALLEPVRERPAPPPQLVALLGTAYVEAGRAEDALEVLAPLADAGDADPAVLYNAGRAALAAGEVDRGEAYLERSVALQPDTPAARDLGLLRGAQGRMRQSYRLLRPWALARPDDTEARLAAALAAIQLNRPPEAEELLEGLPAESDRVRLLRGQIHLLRGDPRGALATLAPVLGEEPGEVDLTVRRTMAEAQLALGQAGEAVQLLEGRVEGDPAASLVLGQARFRAGDLEAALATLQPFATRFLEITQAAGGGPVENQQLGARYALEYGRLLATAERHEEALPYLQVATRLAPENRQGWQLLGQTLAALDRRDEAEEALARFADLNREEGTVTARRERWEQETEDPTAREMGRARELLAQERTDQAIAILRAEIELSPDDIRPRLLEAHALLLAGRPGEALQRSEEVVARFPDHPDAYYQRGTAHLAMEHVEPAEADLRQALDLAPDHVPAMNDLAVLLSVKGERAEAVRLLERVLELRPDDPRAQENLERLQENRGG